MLRTRSGGEHRSHERDAASARLAGRRNPRVRVDLFEEEPLADLPAGEELVETFAVVRALQVVGPGDAVGNGEHEVAVRSEPLAEQIHRHLVETFRGLGLAVRTDPEVLHGRDREYC